MKAILRITLLGLMFILSCSIAQANAEPTWFTQGEDKQVLINVDVFLTSTCPHCQKADAFFSEIEKKNPWLVIHRQEINEDKAALELFYNLLQQQHLNDFSVPAMFFCNSHWTGFADANSTGKVLLSALDFCRQKITQDGQLNQVTIDVLQKWGKASQLQVGTKKADSAASLITMAALTDAFSPCSLFAFAAFLAFLWLYPTDRRSQWAVGVVFLLSLGAIHFIQQAHAAFYYQYVEKLKWVEMLVGVILFFAVASTYRQKQTQWLSLRDGPVYFLLIIATVFAVQAYQQTCVFNIAPALEQWLAEQSFSSTKHLAYILMYQLIYLLPLAVFLLCYLLYKRKKHIALHQPLWKHTASLILISIGLILVFYPRGLASLTASIAVIVIAFLGGWMLTKREMRDNV